MEELKRSFRPELLNRIDEVIVFHALSRENVKEIVDLLLKRVREQLKAKDVEIELTDAAKDVLAEKGYDVSLGARPLRRTIQRMVEDQLSEKLLNKEFKAGETIIVDAVDGEIVFDSAPRAAGHAAGRARRLPGVVRLRETRIPAGGGPRRIREGRRAQRPSGRWALVVSGAAGRVRAGQGVSVADRYGSSAWARSSGCSSVRRAGGRPPNGPGGAPPAGNGGRSTSRRSRTATARTPDGATAPWRTWPRRQRSTGSARASRAWIASSAVGWCPVRWSSSRGRPASASRPFSSNSRRA